MRKIISPETLLSAYSQGYFPMAEGIDNSIYWHCPLFRAIFDIDNVQPNKNMKKLISSGKFSYSINNAFEDVILNCSNRPDTWISSEIMESYIILHKFGYAHSVETYEDGKLVGGLYGVSMGGGFFGESMFNTVDNASKFAFYKLIERLKERNFTLLDSQYINSFTRQLGAYEIKHSTYLRRLEKALLQNCKFD